MIRQSGELGNRDLEDDDMMQREMYIDVESQKEKGRLRTIGGIILWGLMIVVSIIFASQSLIIAG